MELIVCARRPLSEKTVAANVLKHGTGALHIDAARITAADADQYARNNAPWYGWTRGEGAIKAGGTYAPGAVVPEKDTPAGRWPANVVLSHEPECQEVGTKEVPSRGGATRGTALGRLNDDTWQPTVQAISRPSSTVPAFECVESCAVRLLDEQAGERTTRAFNGVRKTAKFKNAYGVIERGDEPGHAADSGSASRFYFCAKASPADRRPYNDWPTVKNTDLMRWLLTLVVPPGGTVLDCFAGSGSTLVAADRLGFDCVGIDSDAHALDIARRRLHEDGGMFAEVTVEGAPLSAAEAFDAIEEAFINGRPYPYGREPTS